MSEGLRLSSLALFAVGPVVAVLALLRRGFKPSPTLCRIKGWRWYVPAALLPVEWLLPPALIAFRVGEIEADWLHVRVAGLALGLIGAALLVWASVLLGRFLMHEAALREDHALVASGPYRFVRHPVYMGYLALLLGSGVASLNACLLLLWPVSLLGILIQAASEEQLLAAKFGQDYERYVRQTGRLVPHLHSQRGPGTVDRGGGRSRRNQEVRMGWLRSYWAVKAHLVFLTGIGIATYAILTGDQGPHRDAPQVLLFCGIGYPLALLLSWVHWRINGRAEV